MEFLVDIKNMMMPEFIMIFGILLLCLGSLFFKGKKALPLFVSLGILVLSFIMLFFVNLDVASIAFYGAFLSNSFTLFFKGLVLIGAIFTILLSDKFLSTVNKSAFEFFALLLTAVLGAMILISSKDLVTLYVGLETLGISSYILSGFIKKQKTSCEVAFKYLVTGGVASAVMLYGFSFLYGLGLSLQFDSIKTILISPEFAYVGIFAAVLIVSGICFKLASVPFYNWAPDVYQGSPLCISAFLSTVSKIAGFGILIRVMSEFLSSVWLVHIVVLLISAITMTVGNVLAVRENNIKRLMGYSSIAHAGYILATLSLGSPFGISAAIFYIITYLFMNFAAWGCIETVDKTPITQIEDFKGLAFNHPLLSTAMVVAFISLAGLPLSVGFFSKFYLFQTISFAGFALFPFLFIVLLNSLISVFYYFKVIKAMFEKSGSEQVLCMNKKLATVILITTVFTLFAGLFSTPIIQLSQQIAQNQMPVVVQYEELEDGFINGM